MYSVQPDRRPRLRPDDPPPTFQPQANTSCIYPLADARDAPLKSYGRQCLSHLSGPDPLQVSRASRISVTVEVANP